VVLAPACLRISARPRASLQPHHLRARLRDLEPVQPARPRGSALGCVTRQQQPAKARPSGARDGGGVAASHAAAAEDDDASRRPAVALRVMEVDPTRGATVPFTQTLGAGATVRGAAAALS
jgi:hypothetical protein